MESSINLWYKWDWEKLEMTITHQYVDEHDLANYYSHIGHHEKAIENMKINIKNNPLNLVARADGFENLLSAKRWEEAIDLTLQTKELFPESPIPYLCLSDAYYLKGEFQKALEMIELAKTNMEDEYTEDIMHKVSLILTLSKLGRVLEAEVLLNEVHEREKSSFIDPAFFVHIYSGLGEKEKALDYLEQAYQLKSHYMVTIKTDPFFDGIRQEPRFQTILKKMNFPEVVKG